MAACEYCRKYKSNGHQCLPEDLLSTIESHDKALVEMAKMLSAEFAWAFTLADGAAVKVEFHCKNQVTIEHVRAFARIFQSVAENYILPDSEDGEEKKNG